MGQILKFPIRAARFGHKRVPKRCKQDDPAQLHLFPLTSAQILQFAPDLSHFERALMLDERGDKRAVQYYLDAIAEQDCTADAYCNLGIIESKQGNTAKAFDCFTNSLKHDPRHFEAHYNLGNMYFEVNELRLAKVHYELALELDPSFPNIYFNLALVLSMNNELGAAIKALIRYQALVPPAERRHADELLANLRKSLAAAKPSQAKSP